jgi:hypothetical protein
MDGKNVVYIHSEIFFIPKKGQPVFCFLVPTCASVVAISSSTETPTYGVLDLNLQNCELNETPDFINCLRCFVAVTQN